MHWIRKALKLLVVIALLAAFGFGIFGLGRFALTQWAAILLAIYVSGAALLSLAGIVSTVKIRHTGDFGNRFVAIWRQMAVGRQSPFTRLRIVISNVLHRACAALTWPAIICVFMLQAAKSKGAINLQAGAGLSQLAVDDLTIAPLFMAFALLATMGSLVVSRQSSWYALVFCVCAAAYVSLLCVAVTVAPTSLTARLRRASGNPYKNALLLAFLTTTILIIAYAALHAQGFPTLVDVVVASRGLYSQLASVKEIVAGQKVSSGLVYSWIGHRFGYGHS